MAGACGWYANDGSRSAEHGIAADRFAREIVGFLKVVGSALAAADRQAVGRQHINVHGKRRSVILRPKYEDVAQLGTPT